MDGISVVIPCYNEERTVAGVIRAARACPGVREVVVVADGCADQTAAVARAAGARVVEWSDNRGKGAAMAAGARAAACEVVVFLDGDLLGLTGDHIRHLATPVEGGEADMTLGIFEGGRAATDLAQRLAPNLSGNRGVRRELFAAAALEHTRFGVDLALSRFVRARGGRVRRVPLPGLSHVMKEEELGAVRGFAYRLRMYWEVLRAALRSWG